MARSEDLLDDPTLSKELSRHPCSWVACHCTRDVPWTDDETQRINIAVAPICNLYETDGH